MTVTGRKHNADDIIATVLAVEPMKFIYRGRIAVFSIRVLRDERICVIAEQRPDCSEEEVRCHKSPSKYVPCMFVYTPASFCMLSQVKFSSVQKLRYKEQLFCEMWSLL
jgi:hypothetical protein